MFRISKSAFLATLLMVFATGVASAQTVFWTEGLLSGHAMKRGSATGGGAPLTLFEDADFAAFPPSAVIMQSLAVDGSGGKIYWGDFAGRIFRGSLSGYGAPELLYEVPSVGPEASTEGIAIDVAAGKVYWGVEVDGDFKIQVGDMDGTGPIVDLFDQSDGVGEARGIALDIDAGEMYWVENAKVLKANMDGSGTVTELFNAGNGFGGGGTDIALDVAAGKIYLGTTVLGVKVANMDGSGMATFLFMTSGADGIAVDADAGKIYWVVDEDFEVLVGNLDGSGTPTVLYDPSDGVDWPRRIAVATIPSAAMPASGTNGLLLTMVLVIVAAGVFAKRRLFARR